MALDERPIDLVVRLWLQPPAGKSARTFQFGYDAVAHEVNNHYAIVSARSDWEGGKLGGEPETFWASLPKPLRQM